MRRAGGASPSVARGLLYALALVTGPLPLFRWGTRHPRWAGAMVVLAVGLPLVVAVVSLLAAPTWHPVLDLAMTEFRVRDVGTSQTPLIGLPGRIGTYPAQGSHPGPLSFYLLAPTYRILGSSSWALEAATVVIHVGAIAVAVWIGHRRGGWRGVLAVALVMAVVLRGYGQLALTQPWNPYLPLIAWMVVLLALWAVLCGDHLMLVPLVAAASYCAQTHVPYLPLGAGMAGVGLLAVGSMWWRGRDDRAAVRGRLRSFVVAVAVGAVLWSPPVADQLTNEPGNIRQLLDHFGSPPETPIGVRDGLELALRHLDVWNGLARQLTGTGTFISAASAWRGLVVLIVWVVAAAIAWRLGSRALRALHGVVALGLVLGAISMARIFGRAWFYLTLWAWGVTTLLVAAIVWSGLAWLRSRRGGRTPVVVSRWAGAAGAGALAVCTVATSVAFADAEHPEERLSEAVGVLAAPTYDAVVEGAGAATGPDGRYLVRWSDAADIGSPGYGLLDELERRGLDVAADELFRVPITEHRVRPRSEADAQIHLATGGYVDVWRAEPDAVEVATYDPRTPEQVAEYAQVRDRFAARLEDEGLTDLVASIDTNLFGLSTDTRLSAADLADLDTLIELGQPMVVFVAPPPADDDPDAL